MAIIRTNKYAVQVPSLTEDPTPSSNKLYFQNEAFDKTTLNCLFDTTISWNTAGTGYTTFGYSAVNPGGSFTDFMGGVLQLNGEVTHCRHVLYNTLNDWRNNLDQAPFSSMDPTRPIIQTRSDTNGTNYQTMLSYNYMTNGTTNYTFFARKLSNVDWSVGSPIQNTYTSSPYCWFPVYRNPITNHMVLLSMYVNDYVPGYVYGSALTNIFTATPTYQTISSGQGDRNSQFVGASNLDSYAIFMLNNTGDDYSQSFYKYNDSNNTATLLNNIAGVPAAGGTNAGGARAASVGAFAPKFASRTFTNPNTAKTGFYLPYFDTSGKYQPFYYEWTQSTDIFTRTSSLTMTYPSATTFSTYWTPDTATNTGQHVRYGMQHVYYNESFVYSGTRYVTFIRLHGNGGQYNSIPLQRTFVTYSVLSTDYTNLTYHSSFAVPSTPKNIVWLNDDRTLMGIFTHSYFYVYSFNSGTTGWNQTAAMNYQFNAVGRDSLGRIWAQDSGTLGYGRIHLLSGAVPTTVTVVPASNSYNYSGSTINTTFTVNSYDITATRIAANVTLAATGSALKFVSNGVQVSSIVVSTSTSASTTVNAVVVAAGATTVTTSIAF